MTQITSNTFIKDNQYSVIKFNIIYLNNYPKLNVLFIRVYYYLLD